MSGLLTFVDCAQGMTLVVRSDEGTARFHTDRPDTIGFTSYTPAVAETIRCGERKPPNPVRITYQPVDDPNLAGEPLRVKFLKEKDEK